MTKAFAATTHDLIGSVGDRPVPLAGTSNLPNLSRRCRSSGVTVIRLGNRARRISFSTLRNWICRCSAFTARYGLHARQVAICDPYTEGFDGFVASTVASAVTGWNDSYQVGISPTEDARLSTAHSKVATPFGLKVSTI